MGCGGGVGGRAEDTHNLAQSGSLFVHWVAISGDFMLREERVVLVDQFLFMQTAALHRREAQGLLGEDLLRCSHIAKWLEERGRYLAQIQQE